MDLVLQHLTAPVLVLDRHQVVQQVNPPAALLLGRSGHHLPGHRLVDLIGPQHAAELDRQWTSLADGAQGAALCADGVAYELSALRPDGRFGGAVVGLRVQPAAATGLLEQALQSAPLCLVAFDGNGLVTYAGGSGFTALRQDPDETVGRAVVDCYAPTAALAVALRRCLAGEQVDTVLPYGGRVWDLHYRPTRDGAGRLSGGLCLAQDVTDWLRVPADAGDAPVPAPTEADDRDAVTGLLAREAVQDRLDVAPAGGTLLVLEIEDVAAAREAWGPATGDALLAGAAGLLARAVGEQWVLGWWEPDVFVLLGPPGPADPVASRCVEALRTPVLTQGRVLHLSCAVGAVTVGDVPSAELVAAGRSAVREAQQGVTGMSGWTATPAEPAPPTEEELDVLADLREGLTRDQLSVDYQPIVRVQDGRPAGAEALVRWEHPERGRLPPVQFLALAERTGLVLPLGARVLRQACFAAAGWNRELPGAGHLQVAVNLSPRQLLQPGLVVLVREALSIAECSPAWLVLEVTEAAVTQDQEAATAALRALHSVGVALSLDDGGTGTGSSTYLRRFPFDLLKVDRSFVAGLGEHDDRGDVAASLVSLARSLGVRCVAEGVETPAQLAVLRELGCDLAQGYLFSRPLAPVPASEWLGRALQAPAARQTDPVRAPRVGAASAAAGAGSPETAVRRALELHVDGASLHTVAARLNLEGLRTASGRRWHHTSVARLIAESQFPGLQL